MPEGIRPQDVEDLRQQVQTAIDNATAQLRKIETLAQQRLRMASVEQQHLDNFLDELHYRLEFLEKSKDESGVALTITGPLTEDQLLTMKGQEETLAKRKDQIRKTNLDLQQVSTRLTWLIHQIAGACAWVLSESDNVPASSPSGPDGSNSGEQVMWAQLIMGQEAERARLAREIHDGPAQALANTVMRLQLLETLLKRQPAHVESELTRTRMAVQDSLQDVRRFIFDLRPASLSDVGLLATLRHYTSDYGDQYGVPVELNVPDTLNLSKDQELVVFRVVQEALQNIHKHGEATQISVDLQQRPDGPLVVTVTDNGKGFDPEQVRQRQPSSSGLVNMRERAATVGGTLLINSKPGAGTTVTLNLPMPKV